MKDFESSPLVSIGIPTFNRPNGLEIVLKSILKYNYHNIEIVVSENDPSCYKSELICRDYPSLLINYTRQEKNIGWIKNFTFVLTHSTGDFFYWHADDDFYSADFIFEAMIIAKRDINFVSYLGKTICLFSNRRKEVKQSSISTKNKYSPNSKLKVCAKINNMIPPKLKLEEKIPNKFNYFIYGIHNKKILEQTWLNIQDYYSNERDLITALSLQGNIVTNTKTSYYRSINDNNTGIKYSILKAIYKVFILKDKELNSTENYKLKRLNPVNALKLGKLLSNDYIKGKKLFTFLYLSFLIYTRNLYISIFEILSSIKKITIKK